MFYFINMIPVILKRIIINIELNNNKYRNRDECLNCKNVNEKLNQNQYFNKMKKLKCVNGYTGGVNIY